LTEELLSDELSAERQGAPTVRLLVAFARILGRAGVVVPVDSVVQFVRGVEAVGIERHHVYWTGRTVLVHRLEDLAVYDHVFREFWSGLSGSSGFGRPDESSAQDGGVADRDSADSDTVVPQQITFASYSDVDRLRQKDFAACSPDELEEISRLMRASAPRPTQHSRRMHRSTLAHGRLDARATTRSALRSGGEIVRLSRRRPTSRPRRVVLLCDVSGSMEPYVRALVRFLHVAVAGQRRVEAFAVGTRLTRLTRQLSSRDPDSALRRASEHVLDWSGGTRLGEGIGTFNDRYGMPGMARGAIVVIMSDGLDRGDPERLADEMARLRRAAHRTIWVNPLKGSSGYEPLARGMAAALPYVDRFVEGHSVDSLVALFGVIADVG
jgi:uncharacterized protein with von Willebrand factor type A (vWA) domain